EVPAMRKSLSLLLLLACIPAAAAADTPADADAIWKKIAPYFKPPAELANDLGAYKSPLKFDDGTPVKDAADWPRRRQEILKPWHESRAPWPPVIEKPKIESLEKEPRNNLTQPHIKLEVAPNKPTEDAYRLIPEGKGPFPAVVVVFYDALTGIGKK